MTKDKETIDFRGAEKVDWDFTSGNVRLRYQDGRDITYIGVEIYRPDFVRWMYKSGMMSRQDAKRELRKMGLGFRRSASEPK